ncbi:methylated-DNA--[protein]-cysteine S-methyltransferase [Helicobacter sp. 16-1353]|uniref:methylated-DNA--[protein]-cysteine S-methyltransferase n=1 Tax=Helicobacter sp. 16-1353 TaxID=2004996 RepID=UPI001C65D055|nr:methylated-DNA--[protein]-cysteine S-methyltransferase [Helicobacter sp. 16-1353]
MTLRIKEIFRDLYRSPIGLLEIIANKNALLVVSKINLLDSNINPNEITNKTKNQLESYFNKNLKNFDLPLNPQGSNFNKKVWNELIKIPFGEVKSYKQIAQNINNPNAYRAVGNANNKNPILIIIPCHRVIKNDGSIGGYALEINIKKQLLELENN